MDIREALEQIKETSAQFIVAIDGLIKFIGGSKEKIDGMVNSKAELEQSIADLQLEIAKAQEVNLAKINEMATSLETSKNNNKKSLRVLKEQFNNELNESSAIKSQKIAELDSKISEMTVAAKNLAKEIVEKEKFLEGLNQSIEAIKSKLNR
jgi:chromosome segregation ATPase